MSLAIGAIFIILGLVTGILAGLLGIGGGVIITPVLLIMLPHFGVPEDIVAPMALATSFSIITLSAARSALAHYQAGALELKIARVLLPSLMLSTLLITTLVTQLDKKTFTIIFALILLLLTFIMLRPIRVTTKRKLSTTALIAGGAAIGSFAGLGGISGGVLIVPFLEWGNMDIKKAIPIGSFCGAFLSLSATISLIFHGLGNPLPPQYSLGFVYLPALLCTSVGSIISAGYGVSLGRSMTTSLLKKIFALVLFSTSIYLLQGIL